MEAAVVRMRRSSVTVDESVCEEEGSDDEENNEDVKEYICQLLKDRKSVV